MMVVELIESSPPRKMLSIIVQCIAVPTRVPVRNMPTQMVPAVIRALLPIWSNFLKLNSNPNEKSMKMMPISDHWWTDSGENWGKRPRWGPTRKPATIYPRISGCLSALEMTVKIPAAIRMMASSVTRLSSSDIALE